MASDCHLTATYGTSFANIGFYRSVVGILQYLAFMRPDLAFVVHKVRKLIHNPSKVLTELGLPLQRSPILWCDNIGATYLASNPRFHTRTKHIEIDFYFVRDQVSNNELVVHFISSKCCGMAKQATWFRSFQPKRT